MSMRQIFRVLVPVALGVVGATALAQNDESDPTPGEARVQIYLDHREVKKELAKLDELLGQGKFDDALAQIDRLSGDASTSDGLVLHADAPAPAGRAPDKGAWRREVHSTLDRELRPRLLALPAEARALYDASHDGEARRLEELGNTGELAAFAELLTRLPASSRAPGSALVLAERELERGNFDAAVVRLQEALGEYGTRLTPEELARARNELPLALALAGCDGAADRALESIEPEPRSGVERLLAETRREREARRVSLPPELKGVAWAHDTLDWYEDSSAPRIVASEPVIEAGRVYSHDGTHARALGLDSGKTFWRTALRPGDDCYRPVQAPCRTAVGPTAVACFLPEGGIALLDPASGALLTRVELAALRTHTGAAARATLSVSGSIAGNLLVLAVVAKGDTDELSVLALDARTGALRWKRALFCDQGDEDAVSPIVATGPDAVYVLSCRGVIASFEPTTGSVNWLRRYPSQREGGPGGGRIPRVFARGGVILGKRFRIIIQNKGGAIIIEEGDDLPTKPARQSFVGFVRGKVLAAPPDAVRLFAFDAKTGADAWAVDDEGGDVLGRWNTGIVELTEKGALRLAGAGPLDAPKLVDIANLASTKVVGRPAIAGDVLLLPTEPGILRVDLATGKSSIMTEWSVASCGSANLACSEGWVIAAGASRTVALAAEPPVAAPVSSDVHAAFSALRDPSFAVREAAQERLLGLDDKSTREELDAACASTDPDVRERAVVVRDALRSRERVGRWSNLLASTGDPRDARAASSFAHGSPDVRILAIDRVVASRKRAYLPILVDLLEDSSPRVSRCAALGLLALGARDGMAIVNGMLACSDPSVRCRALDELVAHGDASDLPTFIRALADPSTEVMASAIDGALARGGAAAAGPIVKMLDTAPPELHTRVSQIVCEAKLEDALAAPVLRKLAADPLVGVRLQAIEKMGQLEHPDVFAALAAAVEDGEIQVRRQAWFALRSLNNRDVDPQLPVAVLEKALEGPDSADEASPMLEVAASMIQRGTHVNPRAIVQVASAAGDKSRLFDKALEVLRDDLALVGGSSEAGVAAVGSLTRDPSPDVRKRSYEFFAQLHGPGRAKLILAGLRDVPKVSARVREALPDACDAEVGQELLAIEVHPGSDAELAQATRVLDGRVRETPDVFVPVLLAALEDGDAAIRARAWTRFRERSPELAERAGAYDPSRPEESVMARAALGFFESRHHGRGPDALLTELAGTPVERRVAADTLAELAVPGLRRLATDAVKKALAGSALEEKDEALQRRKLDALSRLTGRDLSYRDDASAADRARALEAVRAWQASK
jgi:HEAT repeat protein